MEATKAKVVLLDDSPTVRKVATWRLGLAGYEARAAADVAEFATCLSELRPAVVLLDVMMPEVFGDDLVAYVRKHTGMDTRVLFLSGLEEEKLQELVRTSGADGYICKTDGFKDVGDRLDAFFARLAEAEGAEP